jgi:hypothetical protein
VLLVLLLLVLLLLLLLAAGCRLQEWEAFRAWRPLASPP